MIDISHFLYIKYSFLYIINIPIAITKVINKAFKMFINISFNFTK